MALLLYMRQGCCLCAGLEDRLRALDPPPALQVVDVDSDGALQRRFGLEVPVLAISHPDREATVLPRVSPRLSGARLQRWLDQQLETLS